MIVDDTVLLAYVEGTLSASETAEVEQIRGNDPSVAARIACLEASQLDFQKAFAQQTLPPLPKSLADAVQQMSASASRFNEAELPKVARTEAPSIAPTEAHGVERSSERRKKSSNERSSERTNERGSARAFDIADSRAGSDASARERPLDGFPMGFRSRSANSWWTAWSKPLGAFAAGALCCGLMVYVVGGPGRGDGLTALSASPSVKPIDVASTQVPVARWIKAAAGYQQLFARETVVDSEVNAASLTKTVDAIHTEDKMALQVPDLTAVGLTLKGVKRLRYHGETLVQIVYLPKTGEPVALCVMKEAVLQKQGVPAQTRLTVEDMDVLTWRQADLRYALIAVPGSTDLPALAEDVESRSAT